MQRRADHPITIEPNPNRVRQDPLPVQERRRLLHDPDGRQRGRERRLDVCGSVSGRRGDQGAPRVLPGPRRPHRGAAPPLKCSGRAGSVSEVVPGRAAARHPPLTLPLTNRGTCRSRPRPFVAMVQAGLPRKGETTMRVMVIVKANKESEAGKLPDEKGLTEMSKFNE